MGEFDRFALVPEQGVVPEMAQLVPNRERALFRYFASRRNQRE